MNLKDIADRNNQKSKIWFESTIQQLGAWMSICEYLHASESFNSFQKADIVSKTFDEQVLRYIYSLEKNVFNEKQED